MIVELISVGTEILLGNIVNTNSKYIAEKCALLGFSLFNQVAVGDNEDRLKNVFDTACDRSDIIILTGGLGPTKDDLTKEVVASAMGISLVEDVTTLLFLKDFFSNRQYKEMPKSNLKQAMIPEGSIVLKNHNGTAPGIIIENDKNTVILLPGPPNEMVPMFEKDVIPYLEAKQKATIYSVMVKLCGIGESAAEEVIKDLIDNQTNPTVAPYAKTGEVHLRITAKAKDEATAKEMIKPILDEIELRLGKYIFTTDENQNLEDVIVELLENKKLTIATVESCTGGLLSGRIINVPGASKVFTEGYITYTNEAKVRIVNVSNRTLKKHGAVSRETVEEMAIGGANISGADIVVAVSGIAGPDGGTKGKPVGLVFIGCFYNGKVQVEEFKFLGNRSKNRDNSVQKALNMVWKILKAVKSEKQNNE